MGKVSVVQYFEILVAVCVGYFLLYHALRRFDIWVLHDHLRRSKLKLTSYSVVKIFRGAVIDFACEDDAGKARKGRAEIIGLLVDVYWSDV